MGLNPFPGPRPYRAADRPRFHGRDEIARRLGASILAHRCVTIFGPSGSGKSSLMQAAVVPRFIEEHAFRTVRVDSWPEDATATEWLADALFDELKLGERPPSTDHAAAVLVAAQRAARRSERPFLIYLDQVEQLLYDARDPAHMAELIECLHKLVEQPFRGLKLVLSLREDYLGRLRDRMEGRPGLLDHDFRVGPLRVGELAEAMCRVAAMGEPPQVWSAEETLDLMMQVRTPGQAASKTAEAQAAYAQIVCRSIWGQRDAAGGASQGGGFDVAAILDEYLESTLRDLGLLREAASRLLEAHLITPDGSRTLRTEKELLEDLSPGDLETVLRSLEAASILRAEEHQGRRYFEIGHDWLAKKVHARVERRKREAEEREREEKRQAEARALEQKHWDERRRLRKINAAVVTFAYCVAFAAVGLVLVAFYDASSHYERVAGRTDEAVREASAIDWKVSGPPEAKIGHLDPLLNVLEDLEKQEQTAPVISRFLGIYSVDELVRPALTAYVGSLQAGCILPVKQRLEERLKKVGTTAYARDRSLLQAYLLLRHVEHLEGADGEVDPSHVNAVAEIWSDLVAPDSEVSPSDLQKKVRPHVRYYLRALKAKWVVPLELDEALIASARSELQKVPVEQRYYDLLANALIDEKRDPGGADTDENLIYPPIKLQSLFRERPEVLVNLKSVHPGGARAPYTEAGHYRVLKNLASAAERLKAERWIVLHPGEEADVFIDTRLQRFASDYEAQYIEEWTRWMSGIRVASPSSLRDAITLYRVLVTPPFPYLTILRALEDHTQWPRDAAALEKQEDPRLPRHGGGLDQINMRADQRAIEKGVTRAGIDVRMIVGRPSVVPGLFRTTVEFGVPPRGSSMETPLERYIRILEDLLQRFERLEDEQPGQSPAIVAADLAEARAQARALLATADEKKRSLLTPLLLDPLTFVKFVKGPPSRQK